MAIAFDAARWDRVKENAARWWNRDLGRALIQYIGYGARDPGRPKPARDYQHFLPNYAPDATPAEMIDLADYQLSCNEYLGDAFPSWWVNFGPGILAGFMGGSVHPQANPATVWFGPPGDAERELADYPDWRIDPEGEWFRRVAAASRAAGERWQGAVQVGMTDLGGSLDVVASFRPNESLLLDLYDHPAEVLRRNDQVHTCWWDAFGRLDALLRPTNPGYTGWLPLFSETPLYILQCDFAYMIGPDQFAQFVLPELAATCKRLDHAFYHLDGVGQLPHLDMLLAIPELKGIQWVPGDGKPNHAHWPEVIRKIRDAGKRMWLWGDFKTFEAIHEQLGGDSSDVVYAMAGPASQRAEAEAFLRHHGAL